MPRAILVDFDTEDALSRSFDEVRPIGVLIEDEVEGFVSRYLDLVTEDQGSGHDNWIRTMEAVTGQVEEWRKRGVELNVPALFTYLADNTYLGLRLHTVGLIPDGMSTEEAFEAYVVNGQPLPLISDEELPDV